MLGHLFLRPYLLAEHTGCARSPNMLDNTRTTYTNAFVRFFAWNMPYHVEHHAYPAVPFHALPRLNTLLRDHITHTGRGYRGSTAAVLRHLRDTRRAAGAPSVSESSPSAS
jgi:fatty acid desaturase